MKFILIALLFVAQATMAATKEDLYGTWRLVSYTRKVVATGESEALLGKAPTGFLSYGRDGRMYAIFAATDRPKPKDLAKLTDAERTALFLTAASYSGTFSVSADGDTVVHHIDISLNEVWTGTHQARHLKLDGRRLTLTTDPSPNGIDGKVAIMTVVWEKLGDETPR